MDKIYTKARSLARTSRGFYFYKSYSSREQKFNITQPCLPPLHIIANIKPALCYITLHYMLLTQRFGELCLNDKEV